MYYIFKKYWLFYNLCTIIIYGGDKMSFINTENFSKKVLNVLWQSDEPLSATQIENIINNDWAIKSIQNTIQSLEKK